MATETAIAQALTMLQTLYPQTHKNANNKEVELLANVWYESFIESDDETFRNAVRRILSKNNWFPTIAQIKEEIAIINNPVLEMNAEGEWGNVISAIRKHGSWSPREATESLNEYTQNIVRLLGGMARLCRLESKSLEFERKNFIDLFNSKKQSYQTNLMMNGNLLTNHEKEERLKISNNQMLIEGKE